LSAIAVENVASLTQRVVERAGEGAILAVEAELHPRTERAVEARHLNGEGLEVA